MIDDINDRPNWREILRRTRYIGVLDRLNTRVRALSSGDRFIFTLLAGLVILTSIGGLFSLEQSLLVEVPTYGGTLREGAIGSPQFVNPLLATSDADRDVSALVYAGLMGLSDTGELVPVLASDYAVSDDGKIYTFTLRNDATFSDGVPVTAADVVFTVKKAQDPGLKSHEYANWTGVVVAAEGDRIVHFTLSKPYAPFLSLMTLGILPAHLWQNVSNTEFPFSALETSPVGAGPFKIAKATRNASGLIQTLTLVANSNFVLGRPYLDSIRFSFYPNANDLVNAIDSGSVESAYGFASEDTLTAPYARVFGVFWNANENKVYTRPEVRKALSVAINRDALIRDTLDGYATPIMGPVPPGQGVVQIPVPAGDSLAEAARILEEGGWEYDGDARAWRYGETEQELRVVTIRTSNVPELKSVAVAVKAAWERLGIAVDIELYEPGDLSQNVIRPRRYEALLYGMVIGRDQDLYAFWSSQERNDPGLNIALYANKNVDALLEETRTTADEETRLADLQEIEDTISADYPAAFLYAPSFVYTVPEDLRGVMLPQIITPADRFATVAHWYRMTDRVWPFFATK